MLQTQYLPVTLLQRPPRSWPSKSARPGAGQDMNWSRQGYLLLLPKNCCTHAFHQRIWPSSSSYRSEVDALAVQGSLFRANLNAGSMHTYSSLKCHHFVRSFKWKTRRNPQGETFPLAPEPHFREREIREGVRHLYRSCTSM